jgi:hypothetical protein
VGNGGNISMSVKKNGRELKIVKNKYKKIHDLPDPCQPLQCFPD